jgi:hypothetical protein
MVLLSTICALAALGKNTPASAVRAYMAAVKNRDFKGVATLVVGGHPAFNYRVLDGKDRERDMRYASVQVASLKSRVEGDTTIAEVFVKYATKDGSSGGSIPIRIVLKHQGRDWKIVSPHSNDGGIMGFAYIVAHPAETAAHDEEVLAPTRNRSAQSRRIGRDRWRLFDQIMRIADASPGSGPVGYSGYGVMISSPRTTMIWPARRADEVLFVLDAGSEGYLTYWKKIRGKATRIAQVHMTKGKAPAAAGTVDRWLARNGWTPPHANSSLSTALLAIKPWAAYAEMPVNEVFSCWVVSSDGREQSAAIAHQPVYQAQMEGFFVTAPEIRTKL